jgi:hypothetical protein
VQTVESAVVDRFMQSGRSRREKWAAQKSQQENQNHPVL